MPTEQEQLIKFALRLLEDMLLYAAPAPAAIKALETYAFETQDLDLATEILEWLGKTQS